MVLEAPLALRGPLGPSDIDPDDVRDVACDATASATVCNPPDPDPIDPPSLPDVGDPTVGAGLLSQLLVVVLVVALVVALGWLVLRWRRTGRPDDPPEVDEEIDEEIDEEVGARVIDAETPPQRWRRLASEHREAGRFRDSIRCEYRGLVGDLARAGFVDEIPGRTSGEERAQVSAIATRHGDRLGAAGQSVADEFGVAADIFDSAWFDDVVVTADDDARFLVAATTVLDAALSGATPRGRR